MQLRDHTSLISIGSWFDLHSREYRWLVVPTLVLLGVFLLFAGNGYPQAIVFDETYLIPNAQSYINGVYFQDSHPPLARLLIALGQSLLHPDDPSNEFILVEKIEADWPQDMDISGYRLIPTIFGIINPVLVFGIVLILTSSEWAALSTALVLLFDNAMLTQSRFALPDSILIGFCLATLLCFVWLQSHDQIPRLREGMIWIGLGFSACAAFMTKFTGLFMLVIVPFYVSKLWFSGQKRQIIEFLIIFSLAFVLFFVVIWQAHFSLLKKNT